MSPKSEEIRDFLKSIALPGCAGDVRVERRVRADHGGRDVVYDKVSIGPNSINHEALADSAAMRVTEGIPDRKENQEKLNAVHELFKATSMWQRIEGASSESNGVCIILEEMFKSLGRKIFRVIQQEAPEAGKNRAVMKNLADQKGRILKCLKDFTTIKEIEANTLVTDSERFLRSEMLKVFRLKEID